MSCVRCQVLSVTNHMSPTQTATAMDPPPGNSPTMHSNKMGRLGAFGGGGGVMGGGRGGPPPANYPLLFTGGWLTLGWLQKPEEKKLKKAGNY